MTPEQILELAKEDRVRSEYTEFGWQDCDRYEFDANELITFATAIAQRTRGECAAHFDNSDAWVYRSEVAAAIRSMGDE